MSFIQTADGLGLIRDQFPRELVRNQSERGPIEDHDDVSIKPLRFERLFDWAFVTSIPSNHDRTRTMQCVHKPPAHLISSMTSLRKVAVRIYGFLGKHNLTPTGNWNRTPRGVPKAVMYLTLEAGSFPEEYAEQKRQVDDLKNMAYRYTGNISSQSSHPEREFYFQRRVFCKAESIPSWAPLETAELLDPDVASLTSKWRLDGVVSFGRRTSTGVLRACSPLIMSTGDFVDITATLDIATITKNGTTKTKIHLSFTRVLQLCPASKMMHVVANSNELSRTVILQPFDGIVLEEDVGESDKES